MPRDFDTSEDIDVIDDVEEVAVRSRLPDGSFGPVYQCRAVLTEEKEAGRRAAWILNAADFPGDVAKGFQLVAECGTDWTVERADLEGFNDWWAVSAVVLPDRCDVLRPDGASDATGKRNPAYAAVYQGEPGRLEETVSIADPGGFGGRGDRRQFAFTVARRMTLRAGDVFRITRADTGATEDYAYAGASQLDRPDALGQVLLTRPDATE
jgi:hypothetical protein